MHSGQKYFNYFVAEQEKIKNIVKSHGYDHLLWFGSAYYVPVLNEILLKYANQAIEYAVDNNPKKWGEVAERFCGRNGIHEVKENVVTRGVKIISPREAEQLKGRKAIFITSKYRKEMKKQALELGFCEEDIFCFPYGHSECIMQEKEITDLMEGTSQLTLREMQLKELEILKDVRDFCEDNGIKYFLGCGTMLGAVRHEGFIPWDDDVDIHMPYEDYMEFVQKYKKTGKYPVYSWHTDDIFWHQSAHVLNPEVHQIFFGYPIQGLTNLHIDIIPMGGWPADEQERIKKYNYHFELDEVWKRFFLARDVKGLEIEDVRKQIMEQKFDRSFYDSEYVGQVKAVSWVSCMPVKLSGKMLQVKFENEKFAIPVEYDDYLSTRYGDYMKLPAKGKQMTHLFPTFIK